MKYIIYLLLFLPLSFFSQKEEDYLIANIHSLQHKNVSWANIETKISNDEKIKLLTSIYADKTETYCKGENIKNAGDFFENFSGVFHFVDIDNDNDVDVLFSGIECAGSDIGVTTIYLNENNTLKKTITTTGKIVAVIKNKYVIVHAYSCCGMTGNTLKYFGISKNNISLSASLSFHTYNVAATKAVFLPQKLKATKKITVTNSTDVRLAAQDSLFENPGSLKTLMIAKTKELAQATVYSTYIDKNSQKWLFVKLDYTDIIQEENLPYAALLGWIKAPREL